METNSQIIDVVHIHNGKLGGIYNFIRAFNFSTTYLNSRNFFLINKDTPRDTSIGTRKINVNNYLLYSKFENLNAIAIKFLKKAKISSTTIIICHDSFELNLISLLGLNNPIVYVLHGDYDYYYDTALEFSGYINKFICVSKFMEQKLLMNLQSRKSDISTIYFPIDRIPFNNRKLALKSCKIAFIGRYTLEKGFHILPEIEIELRKLEIDAFWNLYGQGDLILKWPENSKVINHKYISNSDLRKVLHLNDFYILPSAFEGTPISLIEAMKAGVVCIVNNIHGGIQELIDDNNSQGFKIIENRAKDYAETISNLLNNPTIYYKTQKLAKEQIDKKFDFKNNLKKFTNILIEAIKIKNNRNPNHLAGSRLDKLFIPNFVVIFIRRLLWKITNR